MKPKTQANKQLTHLPSYHDEIPLSQIFGICRASGFEPVDEAGQPWQGIICGESGHTTFALTGTKSVLVLDWYKMQSGRVEINTYIS